MTLLLLVHLAATFIMVGVIWFVQMVHYPLFSKVGSEEFAPYSRAHSRLTSYVVGPPMLLEAATALLLVFWRPEGVPFIAALVGLILIALIWLSTALLQAPRHGVLGRRRPCVVRPRPLQRATHRGLERTGPARPLDGRPRRRLGSIIFFRLTSSRFHDPAGGELPEVVHIT